MTALTWILIAAGLATVAVCAHQVHRLGGPSRPLLIALAWLAGLALAAAALFRRAVAVAPDPNTVVTAGGAPASATPPSG
jgi:hypothetical protein